MKATHAYIGINKQGHVRAFVLDDEGHEDETAAIVASWIKMSRTVERVTVDDLRQRMTDKPSEVIVREMRSQWP